MDNFDKSSWLQRILSYVVWTPLETKFINLNKKCKTDKHFTLKESIEKRFQESTLGPFLYHLNSVQLQDVSVQENKLEMVLYDLMQKIEDIGEFKRRNDICEDVIGVIGDFLLENPSGEIRLSEVLSHLPVLRLAASRITCMDNSLANLTRLKALVLSGNHLQDFPGNFLPRSLHYLELFCNCLSDVTLLLTNSPPELLYVGLCRNNITSGSLQLLSNIMNLHYLDLEDNNIGNLIEVTTVLSQLNSLTSLILLGNPCSMCVSYKSVIVSAIPQIMFLDRVQLNTVEKEDKDTLEVQMSGALQIDGIRIIGIPKPSAEKFNKKKVKHTFHLELECPLLDSKLKEWNSNEFKIEEEIVHDEPVITENLNKSKKKEKNKIKPDKISLKDKSKGSAKKSSKSPKKGKKEVAQEISESEKEFNQLIAEDKVIPGAGDFQSVKKDWENILCFPEPTIEVPVETEDLHLLRDVFRTVLTLRLIHMKTIPQDTKKSKTKTKDKKKARPSAKPRSETELVNETPTDFTISKTLLAKIKVPLQSICWNDKTLDYSWSKHKPLQAKLSPNIRSLQYAMKKGKKDKKGKTQKNQKSNGSVQEVPLPTILTCHIGIGVKRS